MVLYAIEMATLEVNGNLVTLQPGSSQLFSKNDIIMRCEVDKIHLVSQSHYYLKEDVDVAHYTTTNALFNAEIKNL